MIRRLILCLILFTLFTSVVLSDNLNSGKTKVLLIPSTKPVIFEAKEKNLSSTPEGRELDTLIYDDGTPGSGYYWGAGARMAMRMSPAQACTILTIQYYCWSMGGNETIDATIYNWTGSAPGSQLGSPVSLPMNATQQWRNADFTSQNLSVSGDFIASFNMNNDQTVLGFDTQNSGRCWDYDGSSWSAWNETYFIRAIVEYGGGGDPDIDCTPNPLVFNAKDYNGMLEYIYRHYPETIDKELQQKMQSSSSSELIPVIVEFDKLIDSGFLRNCVKEMSKTQRRSFTINTLKDFSSEYQKDVMSYLNSVQNTEKVDRLSQLWLTNSIGMNATKDVISEISNYPTIALVWLDDKLSKPTGYASSGSKTYSEPDTREIVWNILKINADQVWGLGYTGQNIIDGHVDTGVNYNHVDLADHLWDGGSSYPHHGYDFISNDNDPMDEHGHGTHTAGTVAGDGTAGSQTGVAPDCQVMCLRAVPGNLTVLQNAVNFALTNNADVISMSAGWDSAGAGGSWNSLSTQNRYMADNCMTAGIVLSTSAGNGDNVGGHYAVPYDIGIPANTPAPWYGSAGHSSVMAVGATTSGNSVASFSSHGATQWFFSPWYEYTYPPGLIKPDVCAPGGSPGIKSLNYANNNGYVGGWQGTSMACPHLTGLIALMLSKAPSLTPEKLDSIIEFTCLDLGSAGRDNYYGAGLINALDAVNAVGGASVTGDFYCKNLGTATLSVTNITKSAAWITSVSPTSFTVAVGDSQGVGVIIDTIGLSPGTYYDTLWITSNDPDENPYPEVVILYHGTGVKENPIVKIVPLTASVRCNPNPARNSTSVSFIIPQKTNLSLALYDVSGRKVSSIAKGNFNAGSHSVSWNRKDTRGLKVPQGIYFIRLEAKGIETQGKLILID